MLKTMLVLFLELILIANYEVRDSEKVIVKKEIERKNIYDNNSDKFKLKEKEKIILENLAGNISDMILTSIIILDDN